MTHYIYRDLKCPHCGKAERARFRVENGFDVNIDLKPIQCFSCKEYFMPTIEVSFKARKLTRLEIRRFMEADS